MTDGHKRMMETPTHISATRGKVLILDDDEDMLAMLRYLFESEGYRTAGHLKHEPFLSVLKQQTWDLIVMDLYVGQVTALELLPEVAREAPFSKIAVISAFGSIDTAVFAMELGAATFLQKSGDARLLVEKLCELIKPSHHSSMTQVRQNAAGASASFAHAPADHLNHSGFSDGKPVLQSLANSSASVSSGISANFAISVDSLERPLIGESSVMSGLKAKLPVIAQVDATVLIEGEPGTGKELVARAIHELSPRSKCRFEAINCGAIPEVLLESELFGHRKGAFNDAVADHNGLFAECLGGTVFLDEISALPPLLQVKLLHVLQDHEVKPLGASAALPVDVRVIVATNKNLKTEVAEGRFREDLFYRLSVLPVVVPPLRERKDDLAGLLLHFVALFSKRYGKDLKIPGQDMLDKLCQYDWPGNVRELQNALERAVVLSQSGVLNPEYLFWSTTSEASDAAGEAELAAKRKSMQTLVYSEAKESFERNFLLKLLEHTQGNVSEAARVSGRFRSDLYRLMAKYKLQSEPFRKEAEK